MKYKELVEIYRKLEQTTKRLEKTKIVADFIKNINEDFEKVIPLLEGRIFPQWSELEIGVASKIVLKALSLSLGISQDKIEESWKETGDLGKTAKILTEKRRQSTLLRTELTVSKVFDNIKKLAEMTGEGTINRKIALLAELFTSATPEESMYVTRTVLEDLRIGLGEGTVRDAIVWAFFGDKIGLKYNELSNELIVPDREEYNYYVNLVQEAIDIKNDFLSVAEVARKRGEEGLKNIAIEIGKPLKVMLAQKVNSLEEGFETVGIPAAIEYKYDGFRVQIHRFKDDISIFTRRLENVKEQFPEIVNYAKNNISSDNFIIDCEAIGIDPKTGKYLPFQNISQRIKRKYDIEKMKREFPVELNVFDILYFEGKSMIKEPFSERRKLIEKIVKEEKGKIVVAKQLITRDIDEAKRFYEKSLEAGNEGIMMKNLNAPYKPGSRVGYMVKLKPTMKELDLVITGAEWGEGKRANWLSTFTLACKDEENNEFVEVGKVGTGIKEKDEEGISFLQLTEILKPLIISEKGKEVRIKPEIVVEVTYEEIQRSPTYKSGFALRFPRFLRIRDDRMSNEINTLNDIKKLFQEQKRGQRSKSTL